MRVSGIKDAGFAVSLRAPSRRVFIRMGWQRYAATPEEAAELARFLSEAVVALSEGADYVRTSGMEATPDDD